MLRSCVDLNFRILGLSFDFTDTGFKMGECLLIDKAQRAVLFTWTKIGAASQFHNLRFRCTGVANTCLAYVNSVWES